MRRCYANKINLFSPVPQQLHHFFQASSWSLWLFTIFLLIKMWAVICNFNEKKRMQKMKPKKLLTALQIASGLPQTNRIELAACKLGCSLHFPAGIASHAPSRLHKAILPFMKNAMHLQSNLGLPSQSLCGSQALSARAQDAMSSEENHFCVAGTGPEWIIGWLSKG